MSHDFGLAVPPRRPKSSVCTEVTENYSSVPYLHRIRRARCIHGKCCTRLNKTVSDENMNQLLTAAITVFSGVLVYTAGQYFLKLILEPIFEIRKAVARINYLIVYYANIMHSSSKESDYVKNELRAAASRLLELMHIPAWYGLSRRLFDMPDEESLLAAIPQMIGLSNSVGQQTPYDPKDDRIKEIRRLLKLKEI